MNLEEITADINWLISNRIINQSLGVNRNWKWIAVKDENIDKHVKHILQKYNVNFIAEITAIFKTENKERPVCETCGKHTPHNGKAYNRFCSRKCSANSEQTMKVRAETNLKVYKNAIPQQTKEVKEKAEKTLKERYGDNPPHLFGSDYYNQLMEEKYGGHPMKCQTVQEKCFDAQSKNFNHRLRLQNEALGFFTDYVINSRDHFEFTCGKCNNKFEARTWINRPPRCFKCQPQSLSPQHIQVRNFLKLHNIDFDENNRCVIKPKELDFYIPDFKLAIEINGLYWHSEAAGSSKEYHQQKSLACHEKGISLVHLFEDELELNFEITMHEIFERYFLNSKLNCSGIFEVNASRPLPQNVNAKLIKVLDPEPYIVNPKFKKIKSLKTKVWDSGKFVYSIL